VLIRIRPTRASIAALLVVCALVVGVAMPATTVGASTRRAPLSTKACDAFVEYFQIEFLVAFANAFAGLGQDAGSDSGGSDTGPTREQIQDTFHLILSPKLEVLTGTLAQEGPKSIRSLFARQEAVFARGRDILGDAGLTKKQLKALATIDLSPDTDVSEVLGDVKLSKKKIAAAAKEFGEHSADLNLDDTTTPAQQRAFQNAGTGCGVFPGTDVACDSLVSSELQRRLLGGATTVKDDQGSCTFTGPKDARGDEPVLIVDLYGSQRTFDRLVEQLQGGEQVDADTYLTEGFSSFSAVKTCGRTLYSKTADGTLVVALCAPDDGPVATNDLTEVRDSVVTATA
jgi:hypothetical protein